MGTNYYIHVIPTAEQKLYLIELIHLDKFQEIKDLVSEIYGYPELKDDSYVGGKIHLGKNSMGWKFLWNPNLRKITQGHIETTELSLGHSRVTFIEDAPIAHKFYELTKKGIREFVMQENHLLFDEYGQGPLDKEKFLNWAFNIEGYDGDTCPDNRYYTLSTEGKFIASQGYSINKNNIDFYSDGLRFSTYNDFS